MDQVLRLADVGCEIARITAPTALDAKNLEAIKSSLMQKGCNIPLVADIHFRPDAAMIAADFADKVRINPGNFVDGKAFKVREYTDAQYQDEIKRIEEKFTPLVLKMKKLKRAMRIGTNHGSLSDRIMNRYGDTPEGMVESALEYARICEKNGYFDIVFSMKASNPRVMIAAYRLLVKRMEAEQMNYPLHLGVTEAGDGPDGRIKSAAGIGSLLEDGIGDTIRVSLTEDPEFEIPVAKEIAERYSRRFGEGGGPDASSYAPRIASAWVPVPTVRTDTNIIVERYAFAGTTPSRRSTEPLMMGPISVGGASPIRIVSHVSLTANAAQHVLDVVEARVKRDVPPEILEIPYTGSDFEKSFNAFRDALQTETSRLGFLVSFKKGQVPENLRSRADGYVYSFLDSANEHELARLMDFCRTNSAALILASENVEGLAAAVDRLKNGRVPLAAMVSIESPNFSVHPARAFFDYLKQHGLNVPVILNAKDRRANLATAAVLGSLICDGFGDAISVSASMMSEVELDFAFNLLQACGSRITKTEFVSCPSCGRTLFDLQSTTERIKSKTGHLKGVKIAIMGCIVNGPGEMADADFGYVGGGPGKINLYVGKTCVEKSIPSEIADEKLIQLIKSHGKWTDAPAVVA